MTMIGCQAEGTNQAELNELRKELEETKEYTSVLREHYNKMIDKVYSLIKLEMGKNTKEMEDIWGTIEVDTVPEPKPPPPPGTKAHIR
jgi:predicted nuclease with TOPRIM domain